jgi:hypothetical protein
MLIDSDCSLIVNIDLHNKLLISAQYISYFVLLFLSSFKFMVMYSELDF